MINTSLALRGVIRGKTIELDTEPGLPEGQEVRVVVQPVTVPAPAVPLSTDAQHRIEEACEEVKDLPPGEGLRRAAGAWADDADELDAYLEWSRQQRQISRLDLEP